MLFSHFLARSWVGIRIIALSVDPSAEDLEIWLCSRTGFLTLAIPLALHPEGGSFNLVLLPPPTPTRSSCWGMIVDRTITENGREISLADGIQVATERESPPVYTHVGREW